jgi:hypothetical protein
LADTVDTITVFKGTRTAVYRFLCRSDGTGETNVAKIILSTLTGPAGKAPTRVAIEELQWTVSGFTSVQLNWDHTVPDEAIVLSNVGYLDLTEVGGLVDPGSSGGTGNVTLTSYGASSSATYDIAIKVRLKA